MKQVRVKPHFPMAMALTILLHCYETGLNITLENINPLSNMNNWYAPLWDTNVTAMTAMYDDDNTFNNNNPQRVVLSMPIVEAPNVAVVKKSRATKGFFAWVEPFSDALWWSVIAFAIISALLMNALAWLGSNETDELNCCDDSTGNFILTLYHSFAFLLQGEDYEFLTTPLKIMRLGMLLFVLILVSTYTANLASFFTKPSFIIGGPNPNPDP